MMLETAFIAIIVLMGEKGIYRSFVKPLLDFSLAVVLFLVLMPLLIIIAVTNYLLYRHVIFSQVRPGLNGKLFSILKFQTMKADLTGEQNDAERLTEFGGFLRRFSLDELPQLLNIIKGQMSFIGPRPYLVEYLPLYNDLHNKRHYVKPGITGLAQVNGRNTLDWQSRLDYDIHYVKNISFGMDLKLLMLTFVQLLRLKDVNEKGHIGSAKFTGYSH
jgi:lipopolysaccharide/colanic/teichoic acid biosynthesis glycosyltransferase